MYIVYLLYWYYLFNIVIYIYLQYNSLSDQYLEDISDARQTTAACMISDVNRDQISSMWAVNVENKLVEKHFVILLTNGSHHCSCLSLINRGIICRHYFQIMLRSSAAKFHLRLIPSRWYYKDKDPSKEPFLVANKFEDETTLITTRHEQLTDIQLYSKIAGLTHKVTMKAVKKRDIHIVHILENYLKDVDDDEQNEEQSKSINNIELENVEDDESDKENSPFTLNNPNKQTRSKGRPKGIKRIKVSHEKENPTSSIQYKYGNCGNMGHNKRNCNILR